MTEPNTDRDKGQGPLATGMKWRCAVNWYSEDTTIFADYGPEEQAYVVAQTYPSGTQRARELAQQIASEHNSLGFWKRTALGLLDGSITPEEAQLGIEQQGVQTQTRA